MKRGEVVVVLLIMALLIFPVISAINFSDFWKDFRARITGQLTSGSSSLNITVGNAAPTIPVVYVAASYSATEGTFTRTVVNFTARDSDGEANLNDSTAQGRFQFSGEPTRSNTSCLTLGAGSGTDQNYTCTIDMWYFDKPASWTANFTIKDNNNAGGENSTTTFTFSSLNAMVLSPPSLTWPQVSLTSTDTSSDNDPITINNTGNVEGIRVNITALDLRGETTTTQFIFANNFTVDVNSTNGCSGKIMTNGTSTNVTTTITFRGNNSLNFKNLTSGQQNTTYCLKGVLSTISAQSYSTSFYGPWTVAVVT